MARHRLALPATLALLVPVACGLLVPLTTVAHVGRVGPAAETHPVRAGVDTAQDAAVWIHPADTSLSTVLVTDRRGALAVYDLLGREIQYVPASDPNGLDLRYDFPLGNERVSLVVYGTRDGRLGVYAVDPISRSLFDVAGGAIRPSIRSRGICLYHSLVSDSYYAFVTDGAGTMEQWKLSDDGTGRVTGVRVRSLEGVGRSEGCVADDTHGLLYAAENGLGIWRIAAEPWNGASPTLLDASGSAERRAVDFDDLTIYEAAIGTGYLIASRAGRDSFVVYERRGANVYVASFEVDALARPESEPGASAAAAGQRLGIDVVGLPLGAAFPEGLFVARDAANPEGHRTFNLVPWGSIARALTPNLRIDTSFDPRRFGRAIRANRPPSVRAGPDARVALGGSVSLVRGRDEEPPDQRPHDPGPGRRQRAHSRVGCARLDTGLVDSRRCRLVPAGRSSLAPGSRRSAHSESRARDSGDRVATGLVTWKRRRPGHHRNRNERRGVLRWGRSRSTAVSHRVSTAPGVISAGGGPRGASVRLWGRTLAATGRAFPHRCCRLALALSLLADGPGPRAAHSQGKDLDAWLPSLRAGMWVKVEGQRTPDGLRASKIKVYAGELDEVTVESEVADVDIPRLTVRTTLGVRVVATPDTELEGLQRQRHVSLAFLGPGDRIKVGGQQQKDGSVLAEEIELETSERSEPGREPENKHELTARIESIDAAGLRIVLLGLPIWIGEDTRIRSSLPD